MQLILHREVDILQGLFKNQPDQNG